MKKQIFILLVLASLNGIAQDIYQLQDPGKSFLLLEKGWTYRMGDSPETIFSGSNTKGWKSIQPAADIHNDMPADARTGIGWMRLFINVSKEVRGKQLAMMIRQSVASEIYLNGQPIRQYGTISEVPAEIKAHDPRWEPFILKFSTDSFQFLAIRFAAQPGIRYAKYYGVTNPIMSARMMHFDQAQEVYKGIYMRPWLDFFMHGIIFMVFILHLAFYLMYREQKANLCFSLAAFFSITSAFFHNYYYYFAQADQKFISAVLTSAFYSLSNILMLASTLNFLKKGTRGLLWIFSVIIAAGIFLAALLYGTGINMLIPIQIFGYLIIIIISYKALKSDIPEAGILVVGYSISVLSFLMFLSNVMSNPVDILLNSPFSPVSFIYLLFILAPPTSLSIFLAHDFARTSKSLKQKLDEVELLSEKNVSMEREKQEILSSQNQQLELKVQERTEELNHSLNDLKSTQAQLIQAEKMASLGELTAGIAHEIQNPLNFVNNFSEINAELSEEILDASIRGDLNEVKAIAAEIKNNQHKITEHGKRADAIVKSMLQHSGSSSGVKEQTDINKLADEYFRLAFHGLRAKDKNFNAILQTDFDATIGKINIIPQDIGRVLLNLFNNAFYAVAEKGKLKAEAYEPAITVTTKKFGSKIVISVADNGNGIPSSVKEKIFQPFFTTKPTGQGTGLGLSLSYDIVKAHGGELKVETKEGEGTVFDMVLPV